ncbi:MAG: DUF5372 family protein [Actinomycetota bacterium]
MAENVRSASRRPRVTASSPHDSHDFVVVTHPFHPLAGQRVPVLFERRYASIGHVYVCDGGELGTVTLPESFTDRGLPAEDRPLNVEVLAALAHLLVVLDR